MKTDAKSLFSALLSIAFPSLRSSRLALNFMLPFTIINLKNAVLFCVLFCQSHLTLYIHFSSFTPSCSFCTLAVIHITQSIFFQLSVYFCHTFEVNKELMIWPSWTLNTIAIFLCSNLVCSYVLFLRN